MSIELNQTPILSPSQIGELASQLDSIHTKTLKAVERLNKDIATRKSEIANRWKQSGISDSDQQRYAESETVAAIGQIKDTASKELDALLKQAGAPHEQIVAQRQFYDSPVKVLHAVEPRRGRDYSKRDARNMPWTSCYLELGRDNDKFLRESGFREFPAIAARWIVDGDDTYASRWPGAVALGSIKQLQQEQLQKSNAIDYQVDPPLQIPTAYRNQDIDRLPGGTMYVDSTGPGVLLTKCELAIEVNVLQPVGLGHEVILADLLQLVDAAVNGQVVVRDGRLGESQALGSHTADLGDIYVNISASGGRCRGLGGSGLLSG